MGQRISLGEKMTLEEFVKQFKGNIGIPNVKKESVNLLEQYNREMKKLVENEGGEWTDVKELPKSNVIARTAPVKEEDE